MAKHSVLKTLAEVKEAMDTQTMDTQVNAKTEPQIVTKQEEKMTTEATTVEARPGAIKIGDKEFADFQAVQEYITGLREAAKTARVALKSAGKPVRERKPNYKAELKRLVAEVLTADGRVPALMKEHGITRTTVAMKDGVLVVGTASKTPRAPRTGGSGGKQGVPLIANGTEYPSASAAKRTLLGDSKPANRSTIIKRLTDAGFIVS